MISHEHRCIFSHVPKTAGKSVRWMFGLPEFEWQYDGSNPQIENGFGHRRLVEFSSEDYFARYFKFAFVRNPFDRLVSAFFYLDAGGCNGGDKLFRDQHLAKYRGSFPAFVEDLPALIDAQHFRPQSAWLCDDKGALLSDFVGRYETLEQDAKIVGRQLGLSFDGLPLINPSRHAPYRSYYDDGTRRRVEEIYGDDLERFSYRWAS